MTAPRSWSDVSGTSWSIRQGLLVAVNVHPANIMDHDKLPKQYLHTAEGPGCHLWSKPRFVDGLLHAAPGVDVVSSCS
jgi:hypothetical protein